MSPHSLDDVVARRSFLLRVPSGSIETVNLEIARPLSHGDNYKCEWQLIGPHSSAGKIRQALGVDAVQALWLAMQMAGALLTTSAEAREHRLFYLEVDNEDLDLPVPT